MRVNWTTKAENLWQQQIDKKSLFDGVKAESYSMNSNTLVQVNEVGKTHPKTTKKN